MDTKQPEALRIANTALQVRNKDTPDDVYVALGDCAWALRNLHAENERLRAGYDATRHEITNLQERAQELGQMARCWCHACRPITVADCRMVLCPCCGNKRCPKANDHRHDCTGSNEPGQQGSAYPSQGITAAKKGGQHAA